MTAEHKAARGVGHTPLPWSIDGEGIHALLRGADLTIVATRHRLRGDTHQANAAFIVRACNSHYELLEALEAFQHHVIRHSCSWDDSANASHHHPIWQQVANAIARVRGEA